MQKLLFLNIQIFNARDVRVCILFCKAFVENNPNVRLVYRHFPLDFHPNANVAAEAAEAAGAQGKFWEMHDLLFDRSQEWSGLAAD